MLLAALCLQGSLLVHPLYLEKAKPELRALRHVLILHDDLEGEGGPWGRNHDQGLELMRGLRERAVAGEDLGELARTFSNALTSRSYGSLGCFPRGMLRETFDDFLFSAEMGELGPILDLPSGLHLLERVETHAAVLQIQLDGTGPEARELADDLLARLRAGADFAELAREHSVEEESAARGGRFRVFERGSRDTLLKLASFRAPVGELVGPVETPLGLHILRRVEPEGFPRELWEDNFIRARGILITHIGALEAEPTLNRIFSEAQAQGEEVVRRVQGGEAFAEIAARFNDDTGGKERGGDLGWIHRHNPDLPRFLEPLFLLPPGSLHGPVATSRGVVVLYREE